MYYYALSIHFSVENTKVKSSSEWLNLYEPYQFDKSGLVWLTARRNICSEEYNDTQIYAYCALKYTLPTYIAVLNIRREVHYSFKLVCSTVQYSTLQYKYSKGRILVLRALSIIIIEKGGYRGQHSSSSDIHDADQHESILGQCRSANGHRRPVKAASTILQSTSSGRRQCGPRDKSMADAERTESI